ncbi:MAG: NUDIX domain-containing protein [Bacteroidetes bacterium]|nr:NUDIX domain-containing protein [Bacteroidota bacterium]
MKTIYFGNKKILFSNLNNLSSQHTFTNPTAIEFDTIIKDFLQGVKSEILIKGNTTKNFSLFKKHFVNIEACGGVVKNSNNLVLLIKRLGKWDLPKGKREKNENLSACASREVEEECGINNLEILKKITATYHIYIQNNETILKTTHWFLMKYNGNQKLKPQYSEDISEAIWVDLDKFKIDKTETYPNISDVLSLNKFYRV